GRGFLRLPLVLSFHKIKRPATTGPAFTLQDKPLSLKRMLNTLTDHLGHRDMIVLCCQLQFPDHRRWETYGDLPCSGTQQCTFGNSTGSHVRPIHDLVCDLGQTQRSRRPAPGRISRPFRLLHSTHPSLRFDHRFSFGLCRPPASANSYSPSKRVNHSVKRIGSQCSPKRQGTIASSSPT